MNPKDVKRLKPEERYDGETIAVRCRVSDGVAVVGCALEGSFIAYRDALGHLQRSGPYRRGMPTLLDFTESSGEADDGAVTQRVTSLTRFIESPALLRVAVLTTAAALGPASQGIEHVSRLGIVAAVFTSAEQARAWLLATSVDDGSSPPHTSPTPA